MLTLKDNNLKSLVTMKPLTVSHIIGYDSHLPVKQIKLPLNYGSSSSMKSPTEAYARSCLAHSEFIDVSSQKGHFFSLIQVGITRDMKHVRLTPILADEATSLGVQFQSLEFQLPHPVMGKGTFTFFFVPSLNEAEPSIIIDILDESFLLMTFCIELSDFLMGNNINRLVLDNFSEWVNISVPYSFELRSNPFSMKSLDPLNVIVSMNDGGLLHFQRTSPLSSVDIYNFSDLAPLMSLNFVGNIFSSSNKPEAIIGGLSCNAAVDFSRLNDEEFVILSLNKSIKIYNLKSHKQTKLCPDLDPHKNHTEWVTNVTNKYFQVHSYQSKKTLSLLLPTDKNSTDSTIPDYSFFSWNVSNGMLENFEHLKLEDDLVHGDQRNGERSKDLRIQDFHITESNIATEFFVLLKSNTYSEIACFNQDKTNGCITQVTKTLPQPVSVFAELSIHREAQYYLNAIFNSGMCDKRMVAAALDIFIQNAECVRCPDDSTSLRQRVVQTIAFISDSMGISEASAWYKFTLICLEFRRSGQEALAISAGSDFIFCSEVNGVGVYREAHRSEISLRQSSNDKLTDLVESVSSKLSAKSLKRILEEVESISSIDVSKASDLASRYLSGKISDEEISHVMQDLDSIPNIVEELNARIESTQPFEVFGDHVSLPSAGEGFGLLSMLLTADTFESIRKCHCALLVHLLILLLLCEVNEAILKFMNSVIKKLKVYGLMSEMFNICFTSSGSLSAIEHSTVSLKENSLFWGVAVNQNPPLRQLIQKKKYNLAFDYYVQNVLIEKGDETVVEVVIDLLNRDEHQTVFNQFVPRMDKEIPINSFLIGITFFLNGKFEQFYETLVDYTLFERVNNEHTRALLLNHLEGNHLIRDFLNGIYIGGSDSVITKSNYYHQLSQLVNGYEKSSGLGVALNSSERKYLLGLALKLETSSIEILQASPEAFNLGHLTSVYLRSHFDCAIDIKDFDEAVVSLSSLKPISSKADFRKYFTKLMRAMIKSHKYDRLFGSGPNGIFCANYLLVDSILLEIANDDLVLSNSLKCYELLYSWRLLDCASTETGKSFLVDRRGAAEALYIFITRFQIEKDNLRSDSTQSEDFQQFKLKILELYKIISTTLKTFTNEEDKWFRRRGSSKNLNVITLTELNIEYYRWLKDLEGDFV